MEIRQLRYAVRLAETLHFGRAARLEMIAPSAFSTQIARLEREVGVPLFTRNPHHVALTAAGTVFVDKAQVTLEQLADAAASARAAVEPAPSLRIGIFADAAGELTPAILSIYTRLRPGVRVHFVELSMVDQLELLLDGSIDAAFVYAPLADPRIVAIPVYAEPRMAVVPRRHPLADAAEISVDDLLDEPFAAADDGAPDGWGEYWSCDDRRGEPGRIATRVRSAREGLMATAWLGAVDTVPRTFARHSPHPGVTYVPLADATPSTVNAAFRLDDHRPHVRTFADAVRRAVHTHLQLVPGAQRLPPVPDDVGT